MYTLRLACLLIPVLLACGPSSLLASLGSGPTPTPTFVRARFATLTPTPAPTQPPTIAPTVAPVTSEPTSEPTDKATSEPTDEATTEPTDEATTEPADELALVDDETTTDEQPRIQLSESPIPTRTPTATITPPQPPTSPPAEPNTTPAPPPPPPSATPAPASAAPSGGRIAFPIDDGGGRYDVWAFDVPDGLPYLIRQGARQPSFSHDGQLLLNMERSGEGEGIGWFDSGFTWRRIVNEPAENAYPFWSPDGTVYVYSNPSALLDPLSGNPLPHVLRPCSMEIPRFENTRECKDVLTFGKVTVGEMPVWTADDRVVFVDKLKAAMFIVGGISGIWLTGTSKPELLVDATGYPSDTAGSQVFFTSIAIDNNWEAYAVNLDGTGLINLSNSPETSDGLPTVSPDGNWVAFVSDRDGSWGIWVVPRGGGEAMKLLDFNKINTIGLPWGVGDRDWTLERISWGP